MPELPEVETTRRGLQPHLRGQIVRRLVVRVPRLRWPVPATVQTAVGHQIQDLQRRGKWLILRTPPGALLIHLGMSGAIRVLSHPPPPGTHDHVDLITAAGPVMRFSDPRRFGALLWQPGDPLDHPLLARLGPEPLSDDFDADALWRLSRNRPGAVKSFIMDGRVVVGVGNIYAAEALFLAGIHPLRAANRVSRDRYRRLVECIRQVLTRAIEAGGTTLRDFVIADGSPGYFAQSLNVYGRGGLPCPVCAATLKQRVIGQRGTVYCTVCQR